MSGLSRFALYLDVIIEPDDRYSQVIEGAGGMSPAAVAGIIAGVVLLAAAAAAVVILISKKKEK